jgi:hypothetical protein
MVELGLQPRLFQRQGRALVEFEEMGDKKKWTVTTNKQKKGKLTLFLFSSFGGELVGVELRVLHFLDR